MSEPQIFVDDIRIAHKEGVVRKVHACRKLPRPVLRAEKPWEATGIDHRVYLYGTVLEKMRCNGFRMWYMRYHDCVLYATSIDGIRWERPNLGFVEFEGSKENNILPVRLHSPSIIFDPEEPDTGRRYKMLGYGERNRRKGYCAAHSPDGLQWMFYDENPILVGGDTCTLTWDRHTGEYLAFHKLTHDYRGHGRRLVYLAVSRDMQHWSEPRLVMAPDQHDDQQTRDEGGLFSQFYNVSVFPYAGQWLGLVTHFRYTGPPGAKGPGQSRDDGPIDVQLVHSRDGRAWSRCEERSAVIPNGPYAYDAGCILGVANVPVIAGDEMWIYYTAVSTTHGDYLPRKKITIARAAWRLDGWCSLYAGSKGGVVETVVLRPAGNRLFVNADASGGELTVQVRDATGGPLPGYGAVDCVPVRDDGVRQAVRWTGTRFLPIDRAVRIRFRIKNTHLYSYTVE